MDFFMSIYDKMQWSDNVILNVLMVLVMLPSLTLIFSYFFSEIYKIIVQKRTRMGYLFVYLISGVMAILVFILALTQWINNFDVVNTLLCSISLGVISALAFALALVLSILFKQNNS